MFRRLHAHRLRTLSLLAAALSMAPLVDSARSVAGELLLLPVIQLQKPMSEADAFLDQLDTATAPAEAAAADHRNFFKRVFGAPRATGSIDKPVTGSQAPAGTRTLVVADNDPYFDRWQQDANAKLREENERSTPKLHTFAAAQPDKSVVVCEAGCRNAKIEIVYAAPPLPALLPVKTFETTSSDSDVTPASANQVVALAAPADDSSLPCIAGCYDKPEPKRTVVALHKAELVPAAAPPVVIVPALVAPAVAAVIDDRQPPRVHRLAPKKPRFARRAAHHTQSALNGAIVEHRPRPMHRSTAAVLKKSNALKNALDRRPNNIRNVAAAAGWSTTVTRAAIRHRRKNRLLHWTGAARRSPLHPRYARYAAH